MDKLIQAILEGLKPGQWNDNENHIRKCLFEARFYTEDELILFATDCLKAKKVLLNPVEWGEYTSITKEWLLEEKFEQKSEGVFELRENNKGLFYFMGDGMVSLNMNLEKEMYHHYCDNIQYQNQIYKIRLYLKEHGEPIDD